MKKLFFTAVLIGFTVSGIFAQSMSTPKINKKQNTQVGKISNGIESGELTRGETKRLLNKEIKLQKMKKVAKADGMVTPKERAKLTKQAKKLDAQIYKKKHNMQKRK